MEIHIKNLRLRTIIGIYDWEKKNKQDVIVNAKIKFDGSKAIASDEIEDTVNYKSICKGMIALVEENHYNLIEKLVGALLNFIMEDPKVQAVSIEADKPGALRFSDSVSITESKVRA